MSNQKYSISDTDELKYKSLFFKEDIIYESNKQINNNQNSFKHKSKNAMKQFNEIINSIKKQTDEELINGPTGKITELIKIATTSTGLAFVAGLQSIIPYIVYRFVKHEVNQSKRKKLLQELIVNRNVVQEKLEDLKNSGDLSKEEKDKKYKLIKTLSILNQNITKLEKKVGPNN